MTNKLFGVKRKGYDLIEVERYVAAVEDRAVRFQQEIGFLQAALSERDKELNELRGMRELITKTILSATEKSEQMEKLSKEKFLAEMEELKAFHERWLSFYSAASAKYPAAADFKQFNDDLSGVLSADLAKAYGEADEQFKSETRRLFESEKGAKKEQKPFNPEEQIKKFLDNRPPQKPQKPAKNEPHAAAKEEFSFEEALNPKQPLEDILKDLGIK